jgi:nucleoside-diphosphate-sugar epimerase
MTGISLIVHALEEGHEIIAIARPGSAGIGHIPGSDKITVRECDISDYGSMTGTDRCDLFFHLAWDKTSVSGRDDMSVQMRNADHVIDAVKLAKSWNASAFIGVGSQAEYGLLSGKADGNTPTNPTSGYGIAKYSAGRRSAKLCRELGMRFCWTRIFSSYGEYDRDYTLIMYLIRALLNGACPELTKCEQIWDYIYTGDVARALLAIGMRGKDGSTYPIGSGECRSLREYVTDVRDSIDPDIELRFGIKDYYPHQQMFLCADITELTADTGFVPKYSFKEGIVRTVSFVRSHSDSMFHRD